MVSDSVEKYIDQAEKILAQIRNTQGKNIERAAQICTESIFGGGLVHLFGTGHSRILVEEMILRQGIVGTGFDLLA
ncbi:MAG: SIS domain-containing protein, partial [candidate division Zixibacteria bacterium]|nr:SIS domain-containing protein [candidate division Zixibacteria bacterium]NIR63771.1 SIS domain-containing protein [candidate division Zixibacteria bacterium]NIS45731.1 SIS domain-containing protein [candidate division Zixibacteria bacterium]NIU13849.1 SIS domain-containing protein [candidate division Zixibacteria bacterium]NIV05903.1 SIS domain-containing protein [candidate division Zixibacteria bacterium]